MRWCVRAFPALLGHRAVSQPALQHLVDVVHEELAKVARDLDVGDVDHVVVKEKVDVNRGHPDPVEGGALYRDELLALLFVLVQVNAELLGVLSGRAQRTAQSRVRTARLARHARHAHGSGRVKWGTVGPQQ